MSASNKMNNNEHIHNHRFLEHQQWHLEYAMQMASNTSAHFLKFWMNTAFITHNYTLIGDMNVTRSPMINFYFLLSRPMQQLVKYTL